MKYYYETNVKSLLYYDKKIISLTKYVREFCINNNVKLYTSQMHKRLKISENICEEIMFSNFILFEFENHNDYAKFKLKFGD